MLKSFTPFRVSDMIFVQSVYIREPKTASQWSCIASLAMGCKKNIAGGRVTKYAADGLQNWTIEEDPHVFSNRWNKRIPLCYLNDSSIY